MRRVLAVVVAVGVSVAGGACADTVVKDAEAQRSDERAGRALASWRVEMDSLVARVARLDSAVSTLDTGDEVQRARELFTSARSSFKHVELALEYYAPSTSRELNGPALPHAEEHEGPNIVTAPTGFQVVEEALFSADPRAEREALQTEVRTLRQILTRARTMIGVQVVTDDRVWDAVKLEMARVVSLGITGFDSPVAGLSLPEADAALEGIARAIAPYRAETTGWTAVDSALIGAQRALRINASRDAFDHLDFLVRHANPLTRALNAQRVALGIGQPDERRAFRMQAVTLFDADAFDVLAFAPIDTRQEPAARVALGRALFHDTRLSGNNSRACSSCHIPGRAFTDGLKASPGRSGQPLPRNTPTVINIGLQVGSFSDLRTTYLEDQVTEVVQNVDEMHARLSDVSTSLTGDRALAAQFRAAFVSRAGALDTVVTPTRIRAALAAYMRSLTSLNSPVDRALRGDTTALNADERAGFNVFVGKGKCATCHFLPLTNGTVPPMFQKSELEVLGVPVRAVTNGGRIDPDVGRYRISISAPNKYAFRTPTLRNVALTAPYMHNGAYPTLESVVDFYNRGGGAGIGIELDNQTLPPDALKLSAGEQRALVSFLKALTDTTGTQRR
ncbi:cytochrome c peroxidase [Gemmatimonas groenlandica]|uniref:Cytochrome-c peroxidase n=1 Tax=Gemmatimonas groenlandica TaxID=2732249 RepID=A0A6M4IS70_9BACT|nr:cytochrome c peroxidase [Gemmatimonas groenlandica]QJR37005.1 cytochrome-c peroxidase [Gemmatimonas groenlandica]